MLIAALVMAVIGLIALVTAVVTGSEAIAWVCIGASVVGVILLIIDALRERKVADVSPSDDADEAEVADEAYDADYPDEQQADVLAEDVPEEEPASKPEDSESETSR
ncbi:MAG: hypothetical protein QOH60_825 [Mycobacterium sp.]|jgi:hypothetical protein|nr:hypothetical protein [Mycobacterium sp.]